MNNSYNYNNFKYEQAEKLQQSERRRQILEVNKSHKTGKDRRR